jgi:hypothetical protein
MEKERYLSRKNEGSGANCAAHRIYIIDLIDRDPRVGIAEKESRVTSLFPCSLVLDRCNMPFCAPGVGRIILWRPGGVH